MSNGRSHGWYIVETANVSWPGALPWRGRDAAKQSKGYATEGEALARAYTINAHYNARFGQGLPLAVRHIGESAPRSHNRTNGIKRGYRLTAAQWSDLERISRTGGSQARTGQALWRMGLARAQSTTGIHRGPTIWHLTTAGSVALAANGFPV
jgi:hypothetical protein